MASKKAKDKITPMAREILTATEKPTHLASTGRGRSRQPTEFDDLVLEWYEAGAWKGIPVNDEDDLESVYNQVKKAADFHNLGIDRQKDTTGDPMAVWVFVRDPQHRGPKVGSRKDPRTGKMVQPDDDGYQELVEWLNTDEGKEAAAQARTNRQTQDA